MTHRKLHRAIRIELLALLITGSCSAMTAVAEPVSAQITIEGKAAGTTDNAMEQAKLDALRRAVEQTCGTFINAQTRTANYSVVYDKVMSEPVGYVEQFDVIEQRTADGMSFCKIKAVVSKASFEQEWTRLAHTLQAEDNPRCMVIISERNDSEGKVTPRFNGITQSVVENFFLERGIQLIDKAGIDETRERDIAVAVLKDDFKKLAAVAASLRAEVMIFGNAEARRAGAGEVAGTRLYKWTATINIRAYNADTAQLLMSNSYTSTYSSVNYEAGDEALRRCAEQHAPSFLRDIGEAWRKRQNVRRVVQIVIEDCNRADYKVLETALREVTGVQAVRLRELISGTCHLDVEWAYDTEALVSRIEELKLDGLSFLVTEQTHGKATLKMVR